MIWMAVTADEYELPLVARDGYRELSISLGISKHGAYKLWEKGNVSKYTFNGEHYKVVRVEE